MPYKDPEVRKRKAKEYSKKHYESNKPTVRANTRKSRIACNAKWQEFKSTLACVNCGFTHFAALDFHHVIRKPSNRKMYKLIANSNYKAALEEVAKCVPLCANCHRIHHYEERLHKKKRTKKNPAS